MQASLRLSLAASILLAACGGGSADTDLAAADSLARDLAMPPAESTLVLNDLPVPPGEQPAPVVQPPTRTPPVTRPAVTPPATPAPAPAPPPAPVEPAGSTLATGTTMTLAAGKEINSRVNKTGETFTATLESAVTDAAGRTVIPAGAVVTLRIDSIAPSANRGDTTGVLRLRATSVAFGGERYDLDARSTSVAYTLKGRGVTTDAAAKTGAGAVAGAVAGRILGGGSRGSVVGGVVGAATGAAIAAETADRDVVVAAGARIVVALREALTIPRD